MIFESVKKLNISLRGRLKFKGLSGDFLSEESLFCLSNREKRKTECGSASYKIFKEEELFKEELPCLKKIRPISGE
jgi:hypothetical protein